MTTMTHQEIMKARRDRQKAEKIQATLEQEAEDKLKFEAGLAYSGFTLAYRKSEESFWYVPSDYAQEFLDASLAYRHQCTKNGGMVLDSGACGELREFYKHYKQVNGIFFTKDELIELKKQLQEISEKSSLLEQILAKLNR
jgi:hypothetical protein